MTRRVYPRDRPAACYPEVVSRLDELTAKIDAFFTRVELRHGSDMQCRTGCSDCCHVRLTVTAVEAHAIRTETASWPDHQRAALIANAARNGASQRTLASGNGPPADRCAALDPAGRCLIYAARPVVCRSHGAPIRMREDSLPVVQSCYRNFTHTTPDADCVLDQETLSALVLAVDRHAAATRNDLGDGSRIDLAALLGTM